jgi:hypothetical protein
MSMIGEPSRFSGLFVCLTVVLAACDDGGGSKSTDAGNHDDETSDASTMDAGRTEDAASSRDSGRDASDSATSADAAEGPYQCEPPAGPDGTIAAGQSCCEGLGTCVALGGDAGAALGVGDCSAAQGLRCMPASAPGDAGAGTDGGTNALSKCRFRAATQDGGADYEGRCLPECLTRGTSTLQQGECPDEFVCTPCYNLITGASTGACDNDGDRPVDPAPPGFAECGDSLGYCIPASSVGPTGANLPQLSCEAEERCAPKVRVEQSDGCFPRCDSVFGAGACLPAFLIPMESRGVLQPAGCATGELCSPCINPTTMMRTGACN